MGNSHGALGMGTWCPRAGWAMETPDRGSPIQPLSYWGEQGGKNGFARAGVGPGCSSKGDAVALNDIDVHPNGCSPQWILIPLGAHPDACSPFCPDPATQPATSWAEPSPANELCNPSIQPKQLSALVLHNISLLLDGAGGIERFWQWDEDAWVGKYGAHVCHRCTDTGWVCSDDKELQHKVVSLRKLCLRIGAPCSIFASWCMRPHGLGKGVCMG